MLGHNNPMAIENFSDKMEFQGRGAGHIHGAAWCNLRKISLDITKTHVDSEDEFEDESEDEFEMVEDQFQDITNLESDLEKAFKKLRKSEKLLKNEKKSTY